MSQCHILLQLQEYVLWRLRDAPGQRTLSAFQQQPGTTSQTAARPSSISAALPPSPYKQYAAAAAQPHRQHKPDQSQQQPARPLVSTGEAGDAASADQAAPNTDVSAQPNQVQLPHTVIRQVSGGQAASPSLMQPAVNSDHPQLNNKPAATDDNAHVIAASHRQLHAGPVPAPASTSAPPSTPPGVSDDYKAAYEVAAAARAACDLLRGPPKSSRDDPHFMDSYYKSSRLSFIGRWKARIEALTAAMAADAPVPQIAHQPMGLRHSFKQAKGQPAVANMCYITLDA